MPVFHAGYYDTPKVENPSLAEATSSEATSSIAPSSETSRRGRFWGLMVSVTRQEGHGMPRDSLDDRLTQEERRLLSHGTFHKISSASACAAGGPAFSLHGRARRVAIGTEHTAVARL